jgi:D-arabinose 1-dehydrogenase-like Zn-dependent alcohol dehydrogenase
MGAGLGIVERCGPQATKFGAGQRVVCVPSQAWSALDGSGTWQQAMLVPQDNLYPVPEDVSDQDAAQFAVGRMLCCLPPLLSTLLHTFDPDINMVPREGVPASCYMS